MTILLQSYKASTSTTTTTSEVGGIPVGFFSLLFVFFFVVGGWIFNFD